MSLDVYKNVSSWKKPFHRTRALLAKYWTRLNPQAEIIGITGSVGKTTTKEVIISVLSCRFSVVGSVGNLDPVFNIPITLLKIRPWTKKVVLEYGVEYPGEMDFYLSQTFPKIGVITRIYWTHTEFLKDLEGVILEKGKILEALPRDGWAVLNHDDEYVREMAKKTKAQIFWYGSYRDCDLQVLDFRSLGKDGSMIKLKKNNKEVSINWRLIGEHNTVCAAAAASVGILSGLSLEEIKQGLEKLEPQPHRLNIVIGKKGNVILDDTYNSSPLAAVMALETLRSFAHKGRAIAVLGEMLELGNYAEAGHRQVGRKVAEENIGYLIVFNNLTKLIAEEAQKSGFSKDKIFIAKDNDEASKKLQALISPQDVLLIKGSRATNLDKIVEVLKAN